MSKTEETTTAYSTGADAALSLRGVSFSYGSGEKKALKNVSLDVRRGEFVAVLGHNGSGKSTLARLINGLLSPDEGKIFVLGLDATDKKNSFEVRKNVGIVFQNPDNQTVASIVEDDVAFGPENIGVPREEIARRIDFALSAAGMEKYRKADAAALSGGQKQRVAIAGVLALKPQIIILDESTAMLDPRGRREIVSVVRELNKKEGITVLSITHFPEEAMIADRAIVLHQGEIVLQGKPSDVLKDEEKLETYGLKLPRGVRICRKLRESGLQIADELDPEKIAEQIVKNGVSSGAKNVENTQKNVENTQKNVENTQENAENTAKNEKNVGEKTAAVDCKNLTFSYENNGAHALFGVDLTIKEGEFFGIVGHTGSGKSTFVRHLNALEKLPTAQKKYKEKKKKVQKKSRKKREKIFENACNESESVFGNNGNVYLKEENDLLETKKTRLRVGEYDLADKRTDFFALRSKVGMVFQYPEYQLFAETVFADVAFGYKNFAKTPPTDEQVKKAVREAIEKVGLSYEEVKDKSPFELSGGQKRRVAIAGVIVTKPEILVLDEPAAGLDPVGKAEIDALLKDVHKDWCKTVVVVSHDMDEIAENCDKVAVFSEGKVVFCEKPELLFREHAEKLREIGLDIPVTAKIEQALQKKGVTVRSNLTEEDFARKVADAFKNGGERNAVETVDGETGDIETVVAETVAVENAVKNGTANATEATYE